MTPNDFTNLLRFNTRPGMYIWPFEKSTIVAFIQGYETARGNRAFTASVERVLTGRYKIPELSQGWPGQLELLAQKLKIDWIGAYYLVSTEVLNQYANEKAGKKLRSKSS